MKTITYLNEEITIEKAKQIILEKVKEPELLELLKLVLVPKTTAKGPRQDSKQTLFKNMLLEGPVSEDKLWDLWKWGRHEALSVAWYWRQEKVEPSERLWVWFNLETRCYEVIGQGPEVPEYYQKKKEKKANKEIQEVEEV